MRLSWNQILIKVNSISIDDNKCDTSFLDIMVYRYVLPETFTFD